MSEERATYVTCRHRKTAYSPTIDARVCLDCGNVRPLKQGKYHSNRTTVDGITFQSEREADRWKVLRDMERTGEIRELKRQVRFPLDVGGQHLCDYVADFTYWKAYRFVVEDAKGFRTPLYRLKKKLMLGCRFIEVLET